MFKGLNNDDNDDEVFESSPSLLGNVHDLYEVSIAILRLLANLSIHEVIGNELSSNFDIFQVSCFIYIYLCIHQIHYIYLDSIRLVRLWRRR